MRKLLLLFVSILLVPQAYADIEHFSTTLEAGADGASFRTRILFTATPTGEFEYPILYPIDNFAFSTNFGGTCDSLRKSFGTIITCDFSSSSGPYRTLVLDYTAVDPVDLANGQVLFKSHITSPDHSRKMVVEAKLEPGFVFIEEGGTFVPYAPVNGTQGSDGRSIYVVWEKADVPKGEGMTVSLAYEKAVPSQRTEANVALIIIGIVILFVIALLAVVSYFRTRSLPMLKVDENRIVSIIKENHGMARQNDIVKQTGFSKAKVSRLIKDMEERGIIEIKHVGRNNEIRLGKGDKEGSKEAQKEKQPKDSSDEKKDN